MSLPHYFQDLSILHINTTPHHAYFIPHATHKSAVENPKEYSDYFIPLNGNWQFQYFSSYWDLPENFLQLTPIVSFLCRQIGRITDTININTPMSIILFPLIHLMFRNKTHAVGINAN